MFHDVYFFMEGRLFKYLIEGDNNPMDGILNFDSSDHVRFENGKAASGHNLGCHRRIEFRKDIEGDLGYTMTIYNLDGVHPLWQNNIQMSPKKMKIISADEGIVELRGYSCDLLGNSFENYGILFLHNGYEIERVQLNIYDRNISIVYLK